MRTGIVLELTSRRRSGYTEPREEIVEGVRETVVEPYFPTVWVNWDHVAYWWEDKESGGTEIAVAGDVSNSPQLQVQQSPADIREMLRRAGRGAREQT